LVQFQISASLWLLSAGWLWVAYIALEPFARRRWPGMLVGWSRLLAGNYRDPLVGRDVLAGCVLSVFSCLMGNLAVLAHNFLGNPQPRFEMASLNLFSGGHMIVAEILANIAEGIVISLAASFMVFMLRILLRKTWVAAIVSALLFSLLMASSSIITFTIVALAFGVFFYVFLRFGLLVIIVDVLFYLILTSFPITMQLTAANTWISLTGLVLLLAMTLYGFHTSLGGQPLFGRASLED
jgi:hypothetical protein